MYSPEQKLEPQKLLDQDLEDINAHISKLNKNIANIL